MKFLNKAKSFCSGFYRNYKTEMNIALVSLVGLSAAPAMAVGEATFTPGSSAITKTMLDPIVTTITTTLGTIATSAFLLLGFGLSIYIGFKAIKGMFKNATGS